jgi:hypothetical protein
VLVFLLIICVLLFGLYTAMIIFTSPSSSSVSAFIDGIRLRP